FVGTPSGEYNKEKAVLFFPDVFGIDLINSQPLMDDSARNGFKTIAIDYLNGDPVRDDAFSVRISGNFDFPDWLAKHGNDQTRPNIDKVVAALKEQGVKEFGSTSYCFGARYGFDVAFENITKVSHPSLLEIPEDLEVDSIGKNAPRTVGRSRLRSQKYTICTTLLHSKRNNDRTGSDGGLPLRRLKGAF
ncbi:hypothetical protein EDD15DRAFT_2185029, partial [Pisolithus albus]